MFTLFAVAPASPIAMISMAMVWHILWFHRFVLLAMVPVEGALAYFNLISSLSYIILLFSTINTRNARMHMILLDHGERNGI